jgi:transposase-like protein
MAELVCKHCGSGSFVRNGMVHGRQRYRCKACGRSFTATPPRGELARFVWTGFPAR